MNVNGFVSPRTIMQPYREYSNTQTNEDPLISPGLDLSLRILYPLEQEPLLSPLPSFMVPRYPFLGYWPIPSQIFPRAPTVDPGPTDHVGVEPLRPQKTGRGGKFQCEECRLAKKGWEVPDFKLTANSSVQ